MGTSRDEADEMKKLEEFLDIEYDPADPVTGYVLDVKIKKGVLLKRPTLWDHLEDS